MSPKTMLQSLSVLLAAMAVSTPAVASNPLTLKRWCIEELIQVPLTIPEIGIPVGCEVVDCCPGCPGDLGIDWRIRFEGEAARFAQLTMNFENLPPEQAEQIQVDGDAKWDGKGTLVVTGSHVTMRNFEADNDRPPVAVPTIEFDRNALEKLAARDHERDGSDAQPQLDIIVEQLRGDFVVNEARYSYALYPCGGPSLYSDRLRLSNNTSVDNAVVLLDARRSTGCKNDQIYRTSGTAYVGNAMSKLLCNSEVAVFSDDNAVALTKVNSWTNAWTDLVTTVLSGRWASNVSVWVVMPSAQRPATLLRAQDEMALADQLFNVNHGGVRFLSSVGYSTLTNNTTINTITNAASNVWNTGSCASVGNISGSGSFTPGRMNIYYVNSAFTGWFCPGSNVIAVGTNAQPESLTHEIGHSFSLGHTNNVDYDGNGINDFGNNNIMWGGGSGRNLFSEAQSFRMSVNSNSSLNTNGERTSGLTRSCPDSTITNLCPWLGLDASPN